MADVDEESKAVTIKKYTRDRLISQSEILSQEIYIYDIDKQIIQIRKNMHENLQNNDKLIADPNDDPIAAKRKERDKLSIQVHTHSSEIRIMELEEARTRSLNNIEIHKEKIKDFDRDIEKMTRGY